MRVLVTLSLALSLLAMPAWAKGKKKKKAAPAGEAAPAAAASRSRLYLYDAEHPTAAPTVLVVGEGDPKVPDAPLLSADQGGGAKVAAPAVDKATGNH